MKFTDNPYYYPEKCGLEIFKEIDTGGCYDFDKFVIWKKLDDNSLWWDADSGCSCPSPFDPYNDCHDLKTIKSETFHGFEERLKNHSNITRLVIIETVQLVKNHMRKFA